MYFHVVLSRGRSREKQKTKEIHVATNVMECLEERVALPRCHHFHSAAQHLLFVDQPQTHPYAKIKQLNIAVEATRLLFWLVLLLKLRREHLIVPLNTQRVCFRRFVRVLSAVILFLVLLVDYRHGAVPYAQRAHPSLDMRMTSV